jgi:hypothetical protein
MPKRKNTPVDIEVEVFTKCRRRCCICYGLNRDESFKHGQIAHLDGDPSNCKLDNLAYLCLLHHDQYDSRTSQSKNLTLPEVETYRDELETKYHTWKYGIKEKYFLRYLADQVTLFTMADTAENAAGRYVCYASKLAIEALTEDHFEYSDSELWGPLIATLEHYQAWGWLTYSVKKKNNKCGINIHIEVHHESICKDVAGIISDRISNTSKSTKENRSK